MEENIYTRNLYLFQDLPDLVLDRIFHFLDPTSVLNLRQTSTLLRGLIDTRELPLRKCRLHLDWKRVLILLNTPYLAPWSNLCIVTKSPHNGWDPILPLLFRRIINPLNLRKLGIKGGMFLEELEYLLSVCNNLEVLEAQVDLIGVHNEGEVESSLLRMRLEKLQRLEVNCTNVLEQILLKYKPPGVTEIRIKYNPLSRLKTQIFEEYIKTRYSNNPQTPLEITFDYQPFSERWTLFSTHEEFLSLCHTIQDLPKGLVTLQGVRALWLPLENNETSPKTVGSIISSLGCVRSIILSPFNIEGPCILPKDGEVQYKLILNIRDRMDPEELRSFYIPKTGVTEIQVFTSYSMPTHYSASILEGSPVMFEVISQLFSYRPDLKTLRITGSYGSQDLIRDRLKFKDFPNLERLIVLGGYPWREKLLEACKMLRNLKEMEVEGVDDSYLCTGEEGDGKPILKLKGLRKLVLTPARDGNDDKCVSNKGLEVLSRLPLEELEVETLPQKITFGGLKSLLHPEGNVVSKLRVLMITVPHDTIKEECWSFVKRVCRPGIVCKFLG